jgi:hypothetical protein
MSQTINEILKYLPNWKTSQLLITNTFKYKNQEVENPDKDEFEIDEFEDFNQNEFILENIEKYFTQGILKKSKKG